MLSNTDMDIELTKLSSSWPNCNKNLITSSFPFYSFATDCRAEVSEGRLCRVQDHQQSWIPSPAATMNEHGSTTRQLSPSRDHTFGNDNKGLQFVMKNEWQARRHSIESTNPTKVPLPPYLSSSQTGILCGAAAGSPAPSHTLDNSSHHGCGSGSNSNPPSFKETLEVLLYCYREHGVTMRSEELRSLVEVFICQVYDSLNNGGTATENVSSSSSTSTSQSVTPCSSTSSLHCASPVCTPSQMSSTTSSSKSPVSSSSDSSSSSTSICRSGSESVENVIRGDTLLCPVCYGVLVDPVTTPCGHSYCKKCLQKEIIGNSCRRCSHTLSASDVSSSKTNVLIGSLVEKWWPTEVTVAKLRSEGNSLFEGKRVGEALSKYSQALSVVTEDHLSLGNRSHALLTAGKSEEAYYDAEAAIRFCPTWPKGYFRKSAALISLGRYEEAFLSLTLCMYLIKATSASKEDPALTQVINEMMKILHKIFLQSAIVGLTSKRHHSEQLQFSPYPNGKKLSARSERRRGASHWNDSSEYSSSGDEGDYPHLRFSQYHNSSVPTLSPNKGNCWKSSRIHDPMHLGHHHLGSSNNAHSSPSSATEQLSARINRLFGRACQDLKSFELRLKAQAQHKSSHVADPIAISSSDLECSLCYRLLFQPVSTGCGHTFCRCCLDRCLDHSPACPLCKTSLQNYLALREHAVTEFLETAIRQYLPKEYDERLGQHLDELNAVSSAGKGADSDIPIFVCTMAFPTIPCPLHVFEPRYRLMIRRCMENGTNRFGMCCYVAEGECNYGSIGTLLEIRNIQYFADGRSVVDTVGCRRFRVLHKTVVDGYNTARIELLHDQSVQESDIAVVKDLHDKVFHKATEWLHSIGQVRRQRIHSHFGLMPSPEEDWLGSPDGPSWIWWLLAILPLDSKAQLAILTMCSLQKRLECILKVLSFVRNRMDSLGE